MDALTNKKTISSFIKKKTKKKQYYTNHFKSAIKTTHNKSSTQYASPQKARNQVQHRETSQQEVVHVRLSALAPASGPAAPSEENVGIRAQCGRGRRPNAGASHGVCSGGTAPDSQD
jgi:hypothetical protein